MKRALLFAALVLMVLPAPASAYQATRGPTELLYWNQAKAFEGYTLFAAHGTTYLIDMEGNLVHMWKLGTNPKLLDNGHILDASKDDPSGFGGFIELDWNGATVWQYTETRKEYAPHHDFIRIHNPKLGADTTMYIANRTMTEAEALAVGADPKTGPYSGVQADTVVEVDAADNIIWEWRFQDHLIQDDNAALANYAGAGKKVSDWPGRLDVNLPGRPLRKDWLHCNSLDYNEQLDQVVINSVGGEFYVIDHGNTFLVGDPAGSIALAAGSKGDFLYRFGDPARYGQGDPPSIPANWTTVNSGHKQIGGSHDIHWIRPGLPGEGNFLVFNNGQNLFEMTDQSYADEINPYRTSAGTDAETYVNPPDAGYTIYEPPKDTHKPKKNLSKQLIWRWGTLSPSGMASHIGGSAQRLPNGNTLICADTEGHFVEVTNAGEVVWEYISPVTKDKGAITIMTDALPMTNSVFRAMRFAPDHPAFSGRDLSPMGPITNLSGGPVEPSPEPMPDTQSAEPEHDVQSPEPMPDAAGQDLQPPADAINRPDGSTADQLSGADSCGQCPASDCPDNGGSCSFARTAAGPGWALLLALLVCSVLVPVRRRGTERQ